MEMLRKRRVNEGVGKGALGSVIREEESKESAGWFFQDGDGWGLEGEAEAGACVKLFMTTGIEW